MTHGCINTHVRRSFVKIITRAAKY